MHTPETCIFPTDTEESKRLFKMLNDAYIAARYDPKYTIAPADIDRIRPHVELLRQITRNAYDKDRRTGRFDRQFANEIKF